MNMCLCEERYREGEREKNCIWNGVATKRTLSSISIKLIGFSDCDGEHINVRVCPERERA